MNKKKVVIALIVLLIVVVAVILFIINNPNRPGAHSNVLEDGTRVNNSEKLLETKQFEGLEFSEIKLSKNKNDDNILIQANVKNVGEAVTQQQIIKLNFTDDDGNALGTISWLAPELYPGDSTQLATSSETEVINAYNFTIYK